ncbi:MAG TPA: glycerol dehydrogenase [Actinomycetota bacterium]|nr:glycerol dehydrogenase [Actinomycetota bacterium]
MPESQVVRVLIAPKKYVQGRGVISSLGDYTKELGSKGLVIADDNVWGFAGHVVEASFKEAEVEISKETFGGECSHREIDRLTDVAREKGVDVVVGVGGGKTLDTAKATGYQAGVSWAAVPTVASTDAPTSALSVIYTDDGVFEEYMILPRNPDLVLVDTEIAANAPFRFLVSGMGDALATWIEARATAEARKSALAGGPPTMAALALARLCWDTLISYGFSAKQAAQQHVVTPAIEKVVEANTLLSGLGFESGGLAAAHAIHNGLTALEHTHHYMHGEKVNFGTLTQFALEDRTTKEINDFIAFCKSVGLPVTLAEVGLKEATPDELMTVAKAATVPTETIHNMPFPVNAQMVFDAMVAADAYATAFEESRKEAVAH